MSGDPLLSVGIDVGGTKCLALAMRGGEIVEERRRDTPDEGDELLHTLAALAREVADGAIGHVGVGLPGLVDAAGVLRFAPNLRGAQGRAVGGELERQLGVRVQVENDATCAAWGEHRLGVAKGRDDVVLVTLGTGIGGGLVAGGVLVRGANGFAGEVGHMVVDPDGPPCTCGRRGCWETLASGRALDRLAREAARAGGAEAVLELAGGDVAAVTGRHVTRAAAAGDAQALELLESLARWVALGLANLAMVLDPALVVVGGGLVAAGETLLAPVRRELAAALPGGGNRAAPDVVPAQLGERAGALGAASLDRG